MTIVSQVTSHASVIETPCLSPNVLSLAVRAERNKAAEPTIIVVEDDDDVRETLTDLLEDGGYTVHDFSSAAQLLRTFHAGDADCLVVDAQLPGMSGIEIISRMKSIDSILPAILITGDATFEVAVQAIKAGAVDLIQKPFKSKTLFESIETALANARQQRLLVSHPATLNSPDFHFTKRQHEILDLVLDGHPSKIIAADLGISQRTVENHRAAIMKKTGSRSIPQLVRTTQGWPPAV